MADFPVSTNSKDFYQYLSQEGIPFNIDGNFSGASPSANTPFGATYIDASSAFWIESVTLSCVGGYGRLTFFVNDLNAPVPFNSTAIALNGTVTIPIKCFLYNTGRLSCTIRDGDNATPVKATFSAVGWRVPADLNFNAKKTIKWIGDSIVRGTTLEANAIPFTSLQAGIVRDYFISQGEDVRLAVKAMSGYTMANMDNWRRSGLLKISTDANLIFLNLGVNDAVQGIATATTVANAQLIINYCLAVYQDSTIIVLSPSPLNNATFNTNAIALDTALSAMVTAYANAKIKYLSIRTAFDRTVIGNYALSDGIHPTSAKHADIATVITNFLTANSITI